MRRVGHIFEFVQMSLQYSTCNLRRPRPFLRPWLKVQIIWCVDNCRYAWAEILWKPYQPQSSQQVCGPAPHDPCQPDGEPPIEMAGAHSIKLQSLLSISRSPKCNHPPDARYVGFDGLVIGMIVIGDTLSYLALTDLSHVWSCCLKAIIVDQDTDVKSYGARNCCNQPPRDRLTWEDFVFMIHYHLIRQDENDVAGI